MSSPAGGPTRLSLPHLLHPDSWDLPEWNGPRCEDPYGVVEKLGDLDSSIAMLMRYRNSLRPVHRLTTDVMLLVFANLVEQDDSRTLCSFGYGSNPWVTMSHVCHQWRTVVLSCPLLWTRISTRWPNAALTCLERSADAPIALEVCVDASAEAASRVIGAVLPHATRIQHLFFPSTFQSADMRALLAPLLGAPMPALHTLQVYKVRMDEDCFPLPDFFGGKTPSLKKLKLRYAIPGIGSVTYSHLTHLLLKGKKSKPITMQLSRLLGILEQCPHLEVLRIAKTTIVASSTEEKEELSPVSLDHLRLLDIGRSSANMISTLLSHLIMPDCAMRLYVLLEKGADSNFRFGVPDNLQELRLLQNITRLHVEYSCGNDYVTVQGNSNGNLFEFTVTIPHDSDMGEMQSIAGQFLQTVVNTLDLSTLQEFAISESYHQGVYIGLTKRRWAHAFHRMPLLRTLHVHVHSPTDAGFCRSMLAALATERDASTGGPLCPRLETLSMMNDKTWSSLHCYLMAKERLEAGHPLKRVSMRQPYYEDLEDVEDTDLPTLRRVVDNVDLEPPTVELLDFPDEKW
ncbi:hypothetical protein IEO21_01876 [Rhodonia placenta]|uniref:F-box domain-containing protein n=1 Tax=Rhodonia placenta TaxID=104341 RepID=A0A8H7P8T8_9APHY|nr:hypothetical protein IEO21_01876 [Postia placenta]